MEYNTIRIDRLVARARVSSSLLHNYHFVARGTQYLTLLDTSNLQSSDGKYRVIVLETSLIPEHCSGFPRLTKAGIEVLRARQSLAP